jgi:hypothetical protein
MLDEIISIEKIGKRKTLDIEVSGNHLFYANEILTHNSSSDPGLEDTSESFGLPATVDLMVAIITSEELEQLGQLKFKQLKNRLNDVTQNRAFLIGVDRSRMRLYDVEQDAQEGMPEDDTSVMDNSSFGERVNDEGKRGKRFNMGDFR